MIDILPTLALCTRYSNPDSERVRLWTLVLAARHFLYKLTPGPRLLVAPKVAHLAVAEILAYERENRSSPPVVSLPDNSLTSYLVFFAFLLFLAGADLWLPGGLPGWADVAQADSGRILSGEWARCLTALLVHADGAHLLSNLVALGILMPMLSKLFGSGPAWWFFVATGSAGNALNALVHGAGHYSVGASTGVFGVIAVLASNAGFSGVGSRKSRVLIALGVGFSLLALLGTEGEHTDLGAHLFGFLCGVILGGLSGLLPAVWSRKQPFNGLWGAVALLATVWAIWFVLQ